MFQVLIIVKLFVLLFFNDNQKSFAINFVIKHLFTKLSLRVIKIICIITRHYIKKFCHEACITIKFEKNRIDDKCFTISIVRDMLYFNEHKNLKNNTNYIK